MNTKLRANLEEAIDDWMDKECGQDYWIDVYVDEELAADMATAAAAVFDANERGQRFAEDA